MEAFEAIVADALRDDGYWCQTNYRVDWGSLENKERAQANRSEPRIEIDVLAYKPSKRELLVVECKSFQDSGGADLRDPIGVRERGRERYKLFTNPARREVVLHLLIEQLRQSGLIDEGPVDIQLALAFSKIKRNASYERDSIEIEDRGWRLLTPQFIGEKLQSAMRKGYVNSEAIVVAKLIRDLELDRETSRGFK